MRAGRRGSRWGPRVWPRSITSGGTNGVNLADGGNLAGSTTATLTITNVSAANAGSYQVVVSNASGVITSSVAMFRLVSPSSTSTLTYENAVIQANPVAYWPLNETGDTTSGTLLAYDCWGGFNGIYGVAVAQWCARPRTGRLQRVWERGHRRVADQQHAELLRDGASVELEHQLRNDHLLGQRH